MDSSNKENMHGISGIRYRAVIIEMKAVATLTQRNAAEKVFFFLSMPKHRIR